MDSTAFLMTFALITAFLWVGSAIAGWRPTAATLCFLASFPLDKFQELKHPGDRLRICLRGAAVVLSPSVFFLALLHNKDVLLGNGGAYLLCLPVTVLFFDWLLTSMYSRDERGGRALLLARSGLIGFSLFLAAVSGLVVEQKNLVGNLHRQEDAKTMQTVEWQQLAAQRAQNEATILANERRIAETPVLRADLAEKRRLEKLECEGAAGFDVKSGVTIKGGRCGQLAATHRANAEALQKQIDDLATLEQTTATLRTTRTILDERAQKLLEEAHSDTASVGTLMRAVANGAVDLGVGIRVAGTMMVIGLMEACALLMSGTSVSPTTLTAIGDIRKEDEGRLANANAQALAEIGAKRRALREAAARDLPPVVLSAGRPTLHVVADAANEDLAKAATQEASHG